MKKKYLIIVVILAAAAGLLWLSSSKPASQPVNNQPATNNQPVNNQPAVNQPVSNLQTYNNAQYKISLSYQSPLAIGEPRFNAGQFFGLPDGQPIASFVIPKETYPNTNFYEAFLNLSVKNGGTVEKCQVIQEEGNTQVPPTTTVQINGRTWWKTKVNGAAAGTFATSDVYHTFANQNCYEETLNLFEGNIANFDPPVQPVDEQKVYSIMEASLNSTVIIE